MIHLVKLVAYVFFFPRIGDLPDNLMTLNLFSYSLERGSLPCHHNQDLYLCQVYSPLPKNWPEIYFNNPFVNTDDVPHLVPEINDPVSSFQTDTM